MLRNKRRLERSIRQAACNFLQIAFSTLFGYFVDFAKMLVGDFAVPAYAGKLVMLAGSVFLIALGVMLYIDVDLVPMPMEGLSSCIVKKLGKPFPTMKTVVDCIVVATGVILSFVFLGKLDGIRYHRRGDRQADCPFPEMAFSHT